LAKLSTQVECLVFLLIVVSHLKARALSQPLRTLSHS